MEMGKWKGIVVMEIMGMKWNGMEQR